MAAEASSTAEDLRALAQTRPNDAARVLLSDHDLWSTIASSNPHTAADILECLDPSIAAKLLDGLADSVMGEVLDETNPHAAADVMESFDVATAASAILAMEADQAADVVGALEDIVRREVLDAVDDAEATDLNTLLEYAPDTAGGLMTTGLAVLPIGMTAGEAIESLRRLHDSLGVNLLYVYVVDHERRLLGVVSFRDLVFARPGEALDDVMVQAPISVTTDTDREVLAELIQRYHLLAIPVIDASHRLVGMVKVSEALQAVQAEATEDIVAMVGAGVEESRHTSALQSVRLRLPWIILNLFGAGVIAWIISQFEEVIASEVLLAALMPMVAQLGGNTGAQSLAVMIRSMALGELPPGRATQAIRREVTVAMMLAVVMAALAGGLVTITSGNARIGLVMAIAVLVALITGGFAGAAIPVALRRLGQDPALASNIFLTVITDIVGFGGFLLTALILL